MKKLLRLPGFTPYLLVALLNAMVDLGHKIVIQNVVFKSFSGPEQIALTALVNGLILLPFILFFSPSAFIADRFAKNRVIKISAAASIPLTILIVICYHAGLFWPAFGLTFLLAVQSAFYSPAKYGYIKEMTGNERLAQGNAVVQAVTIVAILAGAVLFSIAFEHFLGAAATTPALILKEIAPCGYLLVAGATLETLLAWRLPEFAPGDPEATLDRKQYLTGRTLAANIRLLRENEVIWLSIIGLALFWAVNQVLLAAFGAYLKETTGESNTVVAQGLLSIGGLGVIVGAVTAGRVSRNYIETGTIPLGAMGMTVSLFLLPNLESRMALGALLFCYGIFGGLFIVPLSSLIQFNARRRELGKVLAGNNFLQNACMLVFLGITVAASTRGIGSVPLFYLLAVITMGGMLYTLYKLPHSLLRYLLRLLLSQPYNLTVTGLNNLPGEGGLLLLGNHVSWIDWAVLKMAVPRRLRFVMDRSIYERWYWHWFLRGLGIIPISPRATRTALQEVTSALKNGDCVVIFPEGAISRNGQMGEFKRGFERPARESGCVIVPFYLHGLWGSAFSFASQRLRKTSRPRTVREIAICFGDPLPAETPAPEIKKTVARLSVHSWQQHSNNFDPVAVAWLKTAKRHPGRRAVADTSGAALSHRRLLATCILAAEIVGRSCGKAQNVGILLPASAGGVIANLAVLMRGRTVVNLNYTAGIDALKKAVERAGIDSVITSEQFVTRLAAKGFPMDGLLAGSRVFYMEQLRERIGKSAFLAALAAVQLLPAFLLRLLFFRPAALDSTAAILFSSGSEGTPKGVMLSHRNIVCNVKQVAHILNAREEDVVLGALPLFHAFGLTVTTFMPLIEGIPVVCHPDPTDGRKVGQAVAAHRATFLCATPTFLGLYTRNQRLHPLMFASLRLVVAGAEKLNSEVRTAFRERFGLEVFEGYGTTETTPVASVNIPDVMNGSDFSVQVGAKHGTVGLPLPGTAFRIVDPVTLEDLPGGEAGLILIGGAQIMQGYLDDPEKTCAVISEKDGIRWYRTGDKGYLDENGFLVIVDRYSRFAKIGGEMISLSAVEEALLAVAPCGCEAVAVALPDARKGERIVALVLGVEEPETLQETMLAAGVEPLLVPARFFGVEAIPRLGTGKKDLAGAKKLAAACAGGSSPLAPGCESIKYDGLAITRNLPQRAQSPQRINI